MTWFPHLLSLVDYHAVRLQRRLIGVWFSLLSALSLLVIGLGSWGSHQLAVHDGRAVPSWADDFYAALQLFVLEFPTVKNEVPLALDLARFLAAFVTFSAVIGLLGRVFNNQIQASRMIALGRGHVVLCGLGAKGGDLVERLRRDRHFVVVIEPDADHQDLARCRSWGAIIQTGAPTDPWQLRKARVPRADVLLAVCQPDDRQNVETCMLAAAMCRATRPAALTCVLEVADPDLLGVVRKHEMATLIDDRFNLQFFDRHEACARAMLREALIGSQPGATSAGHLLVVGLGSPDRLGEILIRRAAKDWHIANPTHAHKLIITTAAPESTHAIADLRARHPYLDQVCEIRPHDVIINGCDSSGARPWSASNPPPDAAFVCLEDESKALIAADFLRDRLPAHVPIVVRTIERSAGLGTLITARATERMIAVGLEDRVVQLAATLHPVEELLAQSVHQEYLAYQTRVAGPTIPPRPAARFWEDLTESYRAANRAQARDIRRKLGLVGYSAVPAADGLIELHQFAAEDLERLARDEHDRWVAERQSQGWRYGPTRDEAAKIHPNLVPWDDPRLTETIRDIDRNAIRRLPAVLALADYQVEKP